MACGVCERGSKGSQNIIRTEEANSRLFMDDITTTVETVPQTRYLLNKLVEKLNWAGLRIKPEKCRALVIIKGEVKTRTIEVNKEIEFEQDNRDKKQGRMESTNSSAN